MHTIRYLINELMENAVKFRKGGDVSVDVDYSGQAPDLCGLQSDGPGKSRTGSRNCFPKSATGTPANYSWPRSSKMPLDPDRGHESGLAF